jgi:hypothetical protein
MRPNFQKRSALKVDGRINPAHAGLNETQLSEDEVELKVDGRINPELKVPRVYDSGSAAIRDNKQQTTNNKQKPAF